MEIILAAVPFFFLLIAIELVADKVRGTGYYRFNDAINSLNLGVMSRLTEILKALLPFTVYVWVYEHYALWNLPQSSVWVWLIAFVIYDLGYYWVHRLSHEMAIMWGSHVVHHSSEEYNLTTALRQTGTPATFAWIIYLPLALLGIPPEMLLAVAALNLIYQFWVHTRHINKLPDWFEAVMVTPSHHRVHHALNKEYIDKNYGGVFILWDKWFGSFAAEQNDIDIVYGVSDQLNSWNPIWANFKVYKNLLLDVWHTHSFKDKLKTLLMPPGWRAQDVADKFPRHYATSDTLQKYDISLPGKMKTYVLLQFAILVSLVFVLLLMVPKLTLLISVSLGLFAIFHCWGISALQEQRPMLNWLEPMRLLSIAAVLFLLLPQIQESVYWLILVVLVTANILWFRLANNADKTSVATAASQD